MRVLTFGGWLTGAVMLASGLAILASGIDPLVLCTKQCDIPKAMVALLGPGALRGTTGLFFVLLGLVFLVPLARKAWARRQ